MHQPNRIHSRCGPTLHLQMLSTPPRDDAVSFGFRPEGTGPGGLAPPDDAPLQAHRSRFAAVVARICVRMNLLAMRTGRCLPDPSGALAPRRTLDKAIMAA